jgi:hypothetical protein
MTRRKSHVVNTVYKCGVSGDQRFINEIFRSDYELLRTSFTNVTQGIHLQTETSPVLLHRFI